ncbi:MAG: thiolase family protein [Acidimicrobiales bacterium]
MSNPTDAVIVAAGRTPVGKRGGALSAIRPDDLGALLVRQLLDRAGIDGSVLDDLVLGCSTPVGEQGWNLGRQVVLLAGLPVEVPAMTINRMCASSDQAVQIAGQAIRCGDVDAVMACGVESMSRVPMSSDGVRFSDHMRPRFRLIPQGRSAEMIADKWALSRSTLDSFALDSHQRAVEAGSRGCFDRELVPVATEGEGGARVELTHDEGPRPTTSARQLAALPPAFVEDGRITAGNSSQMSDGAAGVLVMSRRKAHDLGLRPRARVVHSVSVGSDPVLQLAGVIEATHKVLDRAGLSLAEIDHFEVNEAFASVPMAWMAETSVPHAKVNPRGGAIALGHPLGATGARIMVTMLHALEDGGGRYGLQTMCIGHGMANATIIERLDA